MFKLPGLSPAVSQVLTHVAVVFLTAFGGQLIAGASGAVKISTLLAVLTSAAAAGLTAVLHYITGLVPVPPTPGLYGVTLKVNARLNQFLVSIIATFFTMFGSQLVAGATHVTSLPSTVVVTTSALSAAVAGVVQWAIGLIPSRIVTPTGSLR